MKLFHYLQRNNTYFFVVQLLSHVRLFALPWTAARQASLSFTLSQSLLRLMSMSQRCHPTISPSVASFSSWKRSLKPFYDFVYAEEALSAQMCFECFFNPQNLSFEISVFLVNQISCVISSDYDYRIVSITQLSSIFTLFLFCGFYYIFREGSSSSLLLLRTSTGSLFYLEQKLGLIFAL